MAIQKICITCGPVSNVGKTTLTKHLKAYLKVNFKMSVTHFGLDSGVLPMDGEDLVKPPSLESLDGAVRQISLLDPNQGFILDIGSSVFSEFDNVRISYGKSFFQEFDLFIVPMTPMVKPEGVRSAIEGLIEDGADPKKIVVVLNRVVIGKEDQAMAFARGAMGDLVEQGVRVSDEVISEMTFIGRIRGDGVVFSRLCDRETVRKQMRAEIDAGNREEAVRYADILLDGAEARMATGCFVRVFEPLFF